MAWISFPSAQNTAAKREAYLVGLGAKVVLSKRSNSALAYSANGLELRQVQSVTVTLYRGLTETAADQLKTDKTADSTTTTVYYRKLFTNGDEYAAVGITTGTLTSVAVARANEADGWHATVTETVFSAGSASNWTTTRPTSSGSVTVSASSSYTPVYTRTDSGSTLYEKCEITVAEYRYRTLSEANSLVSNNTSNSVLPKKCTHGGGVTTYRYVNSGTNKTAVSRYIDAERLFTVTVTQTVYSPAQSGSGWSW